MQTRHGHSLGYMGIDGGGRTGASSAAEESSQRQGYPWGRSFWCLRDWGEQGVWLDIVSFPFLTDVEAICNSNLKTRRGAKVTGYRYIIVSFFIEYCQCDTHFIKKCLVQTREHQRQLACSQAMQNLWSRKLYWIWNSAQKPKNNAKLVPELHLLLRSGGQTMHVQGVIT